MNTRFDTNAYRNSHGRDPKGRGFWWFDIDEDGATRERAWTPGPNLTYTEAKRKALQEARRVGCSTVKVLP